MRYFGKAMLVASVALCLNLSAYSQDISLKINNVTVKEAMERVKKDTGYSFVFSSKDVNTNQRVTVSVKERHRIFICVFIERCKYEPACNCFCQ